MRVVFVFVQCVCVCVCLPICAPLSELRPFRPFVLTASEKTRGPSRHEITNYTLKAAPRGLHSGATLGGAVDKNPRMDKRRKRRRERADSTNENT